MKVDYIALSIPIFFILIGVELLYAIKKKREIYRLNDAVSNISLGIGQQVTGIFMKTALFFGYLFLYSGYRVFTVENSLVNWVLLFLGVDFFYYWFHRLSHEVNALWAAHIVHHQSEEYNLSVALRQSWFQSAFSWVFYLPLAVIGFDPVMFLTVSSFNTLYQFWIHTRLIGKMGPLEWIFNTPSHHRVHHGSDPDYIDRNHGGTLIIWDRLFGTFKKEKNEPHYGITNPLKSWNPFWANIHYWRELFNMAASANGFRDKWRVFFKAPGWMPESLGGFKPPREIDPVTYAKYDVAPGSTAIWYLFGQFVVYLILSVLILFMQDKLSYVQLMAGAAYVITGISIAGAMFDLKPWTKKAETFRLLFTPLLACIFYNVPGFYLLLASSLVYCILSLLLFLRFKNEVKPSVIH